MARSPRRIQRVRATTSAAALARCARAQGARFAFSIMTRLGMPSTGTRLRTTTSPGIPRDRVVRRPSRALTAPAPRALLHPPGAPWAPAGARTPLPRGPPK